MEIARGVIVGVLLIGPAGLAFFSGGYFDRARLVGAIVAWAAAAAAALVCVRCWPRTRMAWLALGGLGALTAWTLVSIAWAPLGDQAQADAQRAMLYLGAALAGASVLRDRRLARAVEPVLAAGALLAIGEGLSERVLPGAFHLARDGAAAGRLAQPLTYWNAMGLLAAIGLVLMSRIAGDLSRPRWLRVAAYAAAPAAALAVYLTLSRGAILSAGVGFAVLLLLDPVPAQARAILQVAVSAVPPILVAVLRADLRTLMGPLATRERDGLILLVIIGLSGLISAVLSGWKAGAPDLDPRASAVAHPNIQRLAVLGGLLTGLATLLVVVITATSTVTASSQPSASNARLVTTETIRGNFWRAAVRGFLDHPVRGTGAGGFETEWDLQRTITYSARDAHSLYLETLSELGLVGGLALLGLIAGGACCARRAHHLDPVLSAGWIAGLAMWAVHAGFEWDWEMPAVTLVAVLLLSATVAHADSEDRLRPASAMSTTTSDQSLSVGVAG